jgi:phospholipid/cholesterol/gamma-HCH transport system substrate-binding protein
VKFKIRFADQLVGFFILTALLSLVAVIFLLGRTQRWFSRNYSYKTYLVSASGLNRNMPVNFRGIAIGNVKSFALTNENRVEVVFTIQDEYRDRAREGSLVEVLVSPIGLGSQFIFHSGLGSELLEEGSLVPWYDSPEGKDLIARGLDNMPTHEDSIAVLLGMAQGVMGNLQKTLNEVNIGVDESASTALGQSIANFQQITGSLAADMADPDEGIRKIINGRGDSVNALEASLVSLSATLDHVEKSAAQLPREMPQITNLLTEARAAVRNAEDVLIALKNNPLLRRGIPDHAEIDSSGTNPRNISF